MLNIKEKQIHEYKIDGVSAKKAGEWNGQKTSHWEGSKKFYEVDVDECLLKPTFKKHFIKDQMRMCDPDAPTYKKHFDNDGIFKESFEDPKIPTERQHLFVYKNTHSKQPYGVMKTYPKILNKDTLFYEHEYFNNIYSPSKNQLVSEDYLAIRNSVPSLHNIRNDYKSGLFTNVLNKNKEKPCPKKVRDLFGYERQPMMRFDTKNDININRGNSNTNFNNPSHKNQNERYSSLITEPDINILSDKHKLKSIGDLKKNSECYPFNTKKRVDIIEDRRNFIPFVSPGDKLYKSSEYNPYFFKESYIPSSNMNVNYKRGETIKTINFYKSIVLPPIDSYKKGIKYKNPDYSYGDNTKGFYEDKDYIKKLKNWELENLG